MEPLDDLDLFFSDSPVTAAINSGAPVSCIFWIPGQAISMFDGSIQSSSPGMVIKSSDLGVADNDSTVTIAGAPEGDGAYTITDHHPDGYGLTVITLTKA